MVFLLLILIFLYLSAWGKSFDDIFKHGKYPKSVYSLRENQQYWNPALSWENKNKGKAIWLKRTLLAWTTDAWHLAEMMQTKGLFVVMLIWAIKWEVSGSFVADHTNLSEMAGSCWDVFIMAMLHQTFFHIQYHWFSMKPEYRTLY